MSVRKLKLIISDLHLGRGRTLSGGALNPFEEFYFDRKLVEFLGYYCSRDFMDTEIELIINGDFLNFLQTDYRGHFLTVITESVAVEQLRSIVSGHPEVFEALKSFAATARRSIAYVVGNHDQAMLWPGARDYFNSVLATSVKYLNISYRFDGFHVEHGHMHEAANRLDPRRFFLKRNLPEPILNLPFGSHFFVDFVLKIKAKHPHIDKIRPFNRVVRWALFNETLFFLKSSFGLIRYLIRALITRDPRRQFSLKRLIEILFESAVFPDLSSAAHLILQDPKLHTVVFGHSHVYQYRQWSESQEYFNTGTWTDLTSLEIQSLGKITKLTYVLLEYPWEEASGARPFGTANTVSEFPRARARLKEWRGYHRVEEDVAIS